MFRKYGINHCPNGFVVILSTSGVVKSYGKVYSKVKKFNKPKLNQPNKKMFNFDFLEKMNNSLEPIVFGKYYKLRNIKLFLENFSKPAFVRMTGSGSALVAYFISKERCDNAKSQFNKTYKNYWCIASKTI